MSIRIGIARVGLLCFEASGLFLSRPPGVFSHTTTPHILPLHSATRMLATPSATFQSPVESATKDDPEKADPKQVTKKNPEYATVRMMFRGQCNMVRTCA